MFDGSTLLNKQLVLPDLINRATQLDWTKRELIDESGVITVPL